MNRTTDKRSHTGTASRARALAIVLCGFSAAATGQLRASAERELAGTADAAGGPVALFGDLHRMLPADAGYVMSLALGDVDGDQDLDVAVGVLNGQNKLYLNDGAGRLVDATTGRVPAVTEVTTSVALADVDGDGDLDWLTGNGWFQQRQNRLYLNDGAGVFTDATTTHMPVELNGTWHVELGDLDGDGDPDLLVANNGNRRLYTNDGSGVFSLAVVQLPVSAGTVQDVGFGDVDGDGDVDIVTAKLPTQNNLYLNDGAGVFTDATATNMPPDSDETFSIVLGDVDGDDDLDVVTGNRFGSNRLYLNDGNGVFTDAPAQLVSPAYYARDLVLGDVDGDADLDLAMVNGTVNRLYLNDGAGWFTVTSGQLPGGPRGLEVLAAGDLDDDGDLDLLEGNRGQDRLYLNDGDGWFRDATQLQLPHDPDSSVVVVADDVDADGDTDLVFGNYLRDRLYLNDGRGVFTDASAAQLPDDYAESTALALGDVDRDGDLDLVVANGDYAASSAEQSYGDNRLYLNDGAGTFGDATSGRLPWSPDPTYALLLADVDGDGDLDLVLANHRSCSLYYGCIFGQDRLYLNDGTGVFSDVTSTHMPAHEGDTTALAGEDVDGDGDVDLVIGAGGADRLYLNDGAGVFTDVTATYMPSFAGAGNAYALGDVDGDDDPDLVIARSGRNRLFLNDGAGVFSDATGRLPLETDTSVALLLADHDRDGDLDLLVGNGGPDRLLLNDGTGTFRDATARMPAGDSWTSGFARADLDGDRDPDVVAAVGGMALDGEQNRVLSRLERHLAWRRIPAVGKQLVLDLYGPPAASWRLVRSATERWAATHGGPLLATVPIGAASGFLDGAGHGEFSMWIPPDPALVGVSWFWRVRIDGKAANTEVTTFTDL